MGDGIYAAIAGARAEADRIECIANNMANLRTAGFKSDTPVFAEVLRAGLDQIYVAPQETAPDLSQGPLRRTGNPLDVALEGRGFLLVETPSGERLTRAGALSRGQNGQILCNQHPVLGEGGPLQLTGRGPVEIGSDGTVLEGGRQVGRLRLVDTAPGTRLVRESGVRFAVEDPSKLLPAPGCLVRQGFLEQANVKATTTMTQLIAAQRTFEMLTTAARSYKEMASQLAREARLA